MKKRTKITEGEYFDVDSEDRIIQTHPMIDEDEYLIGLFVRTTLEQRRWLEKMAAQGNISLAGLVREAINQYADKLAKKK